MVVSEGIRGYILMEASFRHVFLAIINELLHDCLIIQANLRCEWRSLSIVRYYVREVLQYCLPASTTSVRVSALVLDPQGLRGIPPSQPSLKAIGAAQAHPYQ